MYCIHHRLIRSCIFSILIVLFVYSFSAAQHARMDSLEHELLEQSDKSRKVDVLLELSFGYHQIDISKCRSYAEEALRISEELGDNTRIALSYNNLGIASDLAGNSTQAIEYWEKCLSLSKESADLIGQSKALNNLGLSHKEKGNIEKSLSYFLSALDINVTRGDVKQEVNTLSNIGALYVSLDDMDHAFQYLQEAIEKGEKLGNGSYLSNPYYRMGEYYVQAKDYKMALPHLDKAYDLCKEYAQDLRITSTLRLLGECQFNLGNKEQARASFIEAEEKLIKIGEKYTELFALYNTWSKICYEMGNFDVAFKKANSGYDLAFENNLESSKLSALQLLGFLHEKNGDFEKALNYQKAAAEQRDLLDLTAKEDLVLEIETKYQTAKKEVEIELLQSLDENREARSKTKNLATLISALVSLLIAILAFQLYNANRTKQVYNDLLKAQVEERTKELESTNIKLKNSNNELERFAYIASHDLKTPLRNIISFTGLLERHIGDAKDNQMNEYFTFLKEGGKRMNYLIEDLLEYSKFSSSDAEEISERIDLNVLCKELINTITHTLKERDAEIQIKELLPTIVGNYSSFFLLFKNLIENGIKYNESKNPLVLISFEKNKESFSIFFNDNGIGIQEKFFEKIWDMFSRLHNHSKYEGSGLGLATCKKIMDTLNGTIDVSSKVDEGTIFELKFPNALLVKQSETEQYNAVSKSLLNRKLSDN